MKRWYPWTALFAAATLVGAEDVKKGASSVYDFEMQSIDGKPVKLSDYKGNVLMLVNVASY